ncbi:hypothetical protein M406DRAFT_326998 [Cryphonectria parasitica EP155]|uniref:Uncharacterized protein n=1 Tax=Cryphonectria parasitica (strain ATCC 38755 / EP155) TaxID=660469 RepID=A0A9P4Y9L0_CRYP1|nr:uncharacterized protein M406DRAFT_326998 [Cryphonectria parasitica EP155]KAF3768570.1 hypothetical protein M406DRAFT_326998 [Cryphonectria parasitica EP155]
MDQSDRAAVIVCLGPHPQSLDKTMQSLVVCSGILDYFRATQGRGYIMTINFSGTRLLQARDPDEAQACLREDCRDWSAILARAAERARADAPETCRHVEVVLVGTNDCPAGAADLDTLCRQLKAQGIRVNAVVVEPESPTSGRTRSSFVPGLAGGWIVLDDGPAGEARRRQTGPNWGMVQIARGTGGLTLMPNAEGKLAIYQLFTEIFRRWGEQYWSMAAAHKAKTSQVVTRDNTVGLSS